MADETTNEPTADAKSSTTTTDSGSDTKAKLIKFGVPVALAGAGIWGGMALAKKMGKNKMLFMALGAVAGAGIGYMVSKKLAK